MPPMSSLRTFITALRTGETRTTKALNHVVARRSGATAADLIAALRKRGALKSPLQDPLRQALRNAPLPNRYIEACIDGWPDPHKEKIRLAILRAIRDRRRVRFVWGLTPERSFTTEISRKRTGTLTITTLTPRASLRAHEDGTIEVVPARMAAAYRIAETRNG